MSMEMHLLFLAAAFLLGARFGRQREVEFQREMWWRFMQELPSDTHKCVTAAMSRWLDVLKKRLAE